MIDIKEIRQNINQVKRRLKGRNGDFDSKLDELEQIDIKRRKLINEAGDMKAEQNTASKSIPILKKEKKDISEIMAKMKTISEDISKLDSEIADIEKHQLEILLSIPNIPHESVPIGKDDTDNVEIRRWGEPKKADFEIKPHWEIGKDLDILDFERAAKITGSRFCFSKNLGAKLERAIISFFLDTHSQNGYSELFPPFIVNRASMTGTGQLPKFEEDMFKLENTNYFMIPTAEVPVTNMYRNEILDEDRLPLKHCAYSACFRAEAGSAGRDTRGLIRMHQFNKVELVKFCKPENSYKELETLTNDAERVLKLLELPYRVVCLSTGDLSFSSAKTYDIEVWMPSYGRYVEISSCSNFESYQANRMSVRYKNSAKDKTQLVHTLNGSGVAVGRTVAAILENYQTKEGRVVIPEVLRKYMNDVNII
ncbi:MAG: serine--tRNA ligase [Oscillospiraceae bacterium]|nr:serine--tRNA ligase [Oscillospiraceae bacterium]